MTELPLLVVVARYLGISLAVLGALLTASAGARHTRDRVTAATGRALAALRRALRREPPPIQYDVTVDDVVHGVRVGSPTATVWSASPTLEEQLERLRHELRQLEERVAGSERGLRDEQTARQTADTELEQRLRARLDELTRAVEAEQERTATAEARGLPLVAAGVAFTAVPDAHLAALPAAVGWILVVGAFLGLLAYAAWPRRRGQTAGASS